MQLVIDSQGMVRCIYSEAIDLCVFGEIGIRRASHVEPDQFGRWIADLSPMGGPTLGPFDRRSDALAAESAWIEANWLLSHDPASNPS